jgi:hypothetical protein
MSTVNSPPAEINPIALEAAAIEFLKRKCRAGDPFPLIAHIWPSLIVTDPAETGFFEGEPGKPLDPCLCIDNWQRDIIRSFFDDTIREIFIKGNTKAGKGTAVSIAINLWLYVWDECKIILTSTSYEHCQKNLYGEVLMWRNTAAVDLPGDALTDEIKCHETRYLVVRNPSSGEGFSGQHGPRTLFVFDESSNCRGLLYENAQKQFRKIVALSNPRTLSGWFYKGYDPCVDRDVTQTVEGAFGLRRCVTVGGLDCSNVKRSRLETPVAPPNGITIKDRVFQPNERIPDEYYVHVRPLIPNQCDLARFQGISRHLDQRHVDIFAHGKFPTEDIEKQVILASWLRRHQQAWNYEAIEIECFAVDVARSLSGDNTVLAVGGLLGLKALHTWQKTSTTEHAAYIVHLVSETYGIDLTKHCHPVVVDTVGLGAGTADKLKDMGVWVIEFMGGAAPSMELRAYYGNLRAESYGTLGRRLNPDDQWGDTAWMLPDDDELAQELCAPEKVYSSSGDSLRFLLTPKDRHPGMAEDAPTVREKLGRSPDKGDATVMLFHAVRELHSLNSQFAMYSGPLVSWPPAPEHIQRQREREGQLDENENDLVAYLERNYGRRSSGGSDVRSIISDESW